jgi:multiple sugar transport system permease protein
MRNQLAAQPRPAHVLRAWWRRHELTITPVILLAPGCALFAIFVLYPIVENVRLSLYDWDGVGPKVWLGLGNYRELLSDPVFVTAFKNSLLWLLLYFAAPIFGLALALYLHQTTFGIRLVRSLFFVPYVISQVVVGMVFGWFFNSEFGLFNVLLQLFGLGPVAPLESERWAIFAVIIAGLWPQIAYCMMLYLTGLAIINARLVEAARVDGAGELKILWRIVIPQLRPVTFIVAMVCIVGALRGFDLVMIMTLGGPYNSSNVLAYYMYEQTFLSSRYGYAAAVATVLFLLMWACIGFLLWRMLRSERT